MTTFPHRRCGQSPDAVRGFGRGLPGRTPSRRGPSRRPAGVGAAALPARGPAISLPGYSDFRLGAHGGEGTVYRARQDGLGRDVAVKVLDVADPATISRFRRELEISVRLGRRHPHIVTVLGTGVIAGQPCIGSSRPGSRSRTRWRSRTGRTSCTGSEAAEHPGAAHVVRAGGLRHRARRGRGAHGVAPAGQLPARRAPDGGRPTARRVGRPVVARLDAVHPARRPTAVHLGQPG